MHPRSQGEFEIVCVCVSKYLPLCSFFLFSFFLRRLVIGTW